MEYLRQTLAAAPVIRRGEYRYFVHPVTDGIPLVEPRLMREIVDGVLDRVDVDAVDKILTAEAMGIHHATAVSLEADVPFVVARKRSYGFEDEVAVHQVTGYAEGELYVNNVHEGDRVLLVDDVVATGGTLRALCDALDRIGADVVDIVTVVRRAADEPLDLPTPVKSLVDVDVVDGEVLVLDDAD
ncbi:hypoxanthine/guanine phosphoribosyltransferase [Halobacteriaceae archaeon GCM10025711]